MRTSNGFLILLFISSISTFQAFESSSTATSRAEDTTSLQLNELARKLAGKTVPCKYDGQIVSLSEATNGTFHSPCFRCVCQNESLVCSRRSCPSIQPNCPLTVVNPLDQCCPKCAFCVDEWNQRRKQGEVWQPSNHKCSRNICEGGITTQSRMECVDRCSEEIGIRSNVHCCRLCPIAKRDFKSDKSTSISSVSDSCVRCETVATFWQICYRIVCPVLNCPFIEQQKHSSSCCPQCSRQRRQSSSAVELQTQEFLRSKSLVIDSTSSTTCEFNGRQLNVGDSFRVDVCSQCTCTSKGRLICRRYICPIQCEGAVYRPQVCCPFCGQIRKSQKLVTTTSLHFANQTFHHEKNNSHYVHPSLSPDRQCVIQLNSAQMIWKENDRWYPDICTVCDCRAGQVVCQSQTCERVDCSPENQIVEKGKCCPVCRKIPTTTLPTTTTTELPDASSGQCKLSADGHLRTFDGKSFRLERQCANFIVTQQCLFESERPKFLLKMHNDREGQLRKLSIELNENNGIRLGILNFIKGKHLKYRGRRIKLPQHTRIFRAYQAANRTALDLHFVGLKIIWTIEKSVRIFAERQHFDKLCGLCGNFNDRAEDDYLPQFGLKVTENSTEFVDSWRSDEDDECHQTAKDEIHEEEIEAETSTRHDDHRCSRLLSPANRLERRSYSKHCQKIKQNPLLQSCHSVLGIHSFLRRCAVEVCRCQSIESTNSLFKRSTELKNKNSKQIQSTYVNPTTVASVPCYCPIMNDYVQKCASGGLLTMGLSQQSNSRGDGHLSFHPKCPPIKLERL